MVSGQPQRDGWGGGRLAGLQEHFVHSPVILQPRAMTLT